MPEEKCDVNGIDHYDINWVGYQNDAKYAPAGDEPQGEAHSRRSPARGAPGRLQPPAAHPDRVRAKATSEAPVDKAGVQYMVDIPAGGTALLVWDRIK